MRAPLHRLLPAVLAMSAAAALTAGETREIRDAPTNHQMLLALRKAELERAARPQPKTGVSQDASKMLSANDLVARATFLSFNGLMTMVPNGSVMETSANFADRIRRAPGSRMVDFPTFAAANRSWISTKEISYAQARGHAPITEETKLQMQQSGNVVIATFRGNPIEVMPPAPPAAETASPQP